MNGRFVFRPVIALLLMGISLSLLGQKKDSIAGTGINLSPAIDTSVVAQPLNGKVNSQYIESGPMLTKDGKRLYFSRQGHPLNKGGLKDQDIWFVDFDEASQSWMDAANLGAPLNNDGPNFLCGVGWKGDTVLLGNVYNKKGKMKSGISLSIRTGELWSFPVPVYVSNDYNISEQVSYDLSHDRTSLVIAQQKADSYGNLDLYVAFRDPDAREKYSGTESINLGPVINSAGNEASPFLSYDGQTMYFASDGHKGYGGYDIFVSKRLDRTWTNWSKPENLGPGINTTLDDSFFGFTPNDRFAYFSRALSKTNSDIFRIDMTYLFKPNPVPLDQLSESNNPTQVGQTKVLSNVFADNASEINKQVLKDLEYVARYMQFYPGMMVMVGTHSNNHDSRNVSWQLSNDRANKIIDHLVSLGVNRSRLNTHCFGHDIVTNAMNLPVTNKSAGDIAGSVEFRYVGNAK